MVSRCIRQRPDYAGRYALTGSIMQIKLNHSVVKLIGLVASGILLAGAFLDAVSNSLSLISKRVTYLLTAIIITAAIATHFYLKKHPLTLTNESGGIELYKGLNRKAFAALLGVIIMLWIPRLFDMRTDAGNTLSSTPATIPTPLSNTATEVSLRKRLVPWVDRVFISQAENGGIKVNALDPSSKPQVWATAQCIKGVFASQVSIDKYAPQLKAAFNYLETARRNEPEEGWGLFEDREKTITEIAAWVNLAYIASVESETEIWASSELPEIVNRIQRDLEHIAQRQSVDGGWRPIKEDHPGFTRTYSTVMALWSLVEARRSPSLYKVIGNRFDSHIRKGIMWLLSHYEERLGWLPNPNRGHQDERFDGLTAQTLFVLSRAEKDFGFLETEIIYVKAERDFANHKELSDRRVTLNNRIPDIDASDFRPTTYQAETTTFLWFPWSFLALTHLSTDTSLSQEERQAAAQLRSKLLESGADHLIKFVEQHPVYVLGEVLFCLSHSVN